MTNPLPTEKARHYCLRLQHDLDTHGSLDFEGQGLVGTDYLFGPALGQMFGVLVCSDSDGKEVVLKAFSGQYDGAWEIEGWVPPVVDAAEFERIAAIGAQAVAELSQTIAQASGEVAETVRNQRKERSQAIQRELFGLYTFHCIDGSTVSMEAVFGNRIPPTGTGDCCAPKLLNHAFKTGLHPLSMAEFHYGAPNKSNSRIHKQFYEPCDERCKPLLGAMLGLDIVYRDDSIIVVNKPAGLLSVPGRGDDKQDCVVARVKRLFPDCLDQPSVHRLDMDTSGLLVLAFTQEAHRDLSIQFIKRQVHKRYVALLEGVVPKDSGQIELAFRYDPDNRPRQKYDPVLGKWGTTVWQKIRIEPFGEDKALVTRVQFEPLTGRTHQLRLHSAHEKGLGHPIVGDRLYGSGSETSRLMLHAYTLQFTHPSTGQAMRFTLDPDF